MSSLQFKFVRKDGMSNPFGFESMKDSSIFMLIALIAVVIYAKTVFYQYTYFDDILLLHKNRAWLSNLANLPKLFTTGVFISINSHMFYRPLFDVLFMLEMQVANNSLIVFHITSILIHIGCSMLLFVIFRQLRISRSIGAAAALIFCAHPLNASAIAWIPGRNDTLLMLFILASFSVFLLALDEKRLRLLVGHLLLLLFALLTKETGAILPFLCVSYIYLVRKEHPGRPFILLMTIGYCSVLLIWVYLRSLVPQAFELPVSPEAFAEHSLRNITGYFLYIGKVVFPFNLSVFPNLKDHSTIPGLIALALIIIAAVFRRPLSIRDFVWGISWFVLFLAPTFLGGVIAYEHRTYSALFGLFFAFAQMPFAGQIDFSKRTHILGFVGILAILSVISMMHSEQFRDRISYATSAYLHDPSVNESTAALAEALHAEGNNDQALILLKKAIAKDSTMNNVHLLLGDIYADRREFALASNEYEASMRVDPSQLYAYVDYGRMCIDMNQPEMAAALWRKAVSLDPEFITAYQFLATFYAYTKADRDSALFYMDQIQQRGGTVNPKWLHDVQTKIGQSTP